MAANERVEHARVAALETYQAPDNDLVRCSAANRATAGPHLTRTHDLPPAA